MLNPGKHENLPIEQYHGDTESISKTGLSMILDCPARYFNEYLADDRDKKPSKKHFQFGSAFHSFLLERQLFDQEYVILKGADRRCSEYKELKKLHPEDKILTVNEFKQIKGMYDAVWKDPTARRFLSLAGRAEVTYAWRASSDGESSVNARCRPDFISNCGSVVVDIKTAKSANPRDFNRDASRYKYAMSAALTLDGVEAVTGKRPSTYVFIVVETGPNPLTYTTWIEDNSDAYRFGKRQYGEAIHVCSECKRTNIWSSYKPSEFELMPWEKSKLETEMEGYSYAS